MAERIVMNTGPLIVCERIDALEVLGRLPYRFISPEEVLQELRQGCAQGHPEINPQWLTICALRTETSPIVLCSLDAGEAAVIQLAIEQGIHTVYRENA